MQIIQGETIVTITGYKRRREQLGWFEQRGITAQVNAKGDVWTTDDWLNKKDKQLNIAANDDGFNEDFMNHG